MAWTPGPRPEWVDRLNALGEGLGDGGRSLAPLDPATLIAAAERATGLADWGESGFREPFEILTRSLEEEADLHFAGRVRVRAELQALLQTRLRVQNEWNAHPEILEAPVEAPIFVTGLGRSGTTFLHELLSQDPASRVPLLWEILHPVPAPESATYETDPRRELADREIRVMDAIAPEFTRMHENGGALPNECVYIFAQTMASEMFVGQYPVPSYTVWTTEADMRPVYGYHRRFLQLLQWKHPGARWVLKAPSHLSKLRTLFDVYPDARVVITHRDPCRVIGSLASFLATMHWMHSRTVNYQMLVGLLAMGFGAVLDEMAAIRESGAVPADRILDVRYVDLVADPAGTVGRIYAHFGIDYPAATRERIRAYAAARPQGRHGAHRYAFEDTGLDLATERARYKPYQERFDVPSEVQ